MTEGVKYLIEEKETAESLGNVGGISIFFRSVSLLAQQIIPNKYKTMSRNLFFQDDSVSIMIKQVVPVQMIIDT